MKLDLNTICRNAFKVYNGLKPKDGPASEAFCIFVNEFAEVVYRGAEIEKKLERENAASNTLILSSLESDTLKRYGRVKVIQRLNFTLTSEETMRSMVGAVVMAATWNEKPAVDADGNNAYPPERWATLHKSDGIDEFIVQAKDPNGQTYITGETYWIAEPFIPKDGDKPGVVWADITVEQRKLAATGEALRSASAFPKYLQYRRATIAKIDVGTDYRTGWMEYTIVEVEPYKEDVQDLIALARELDITQELLDESQIEAEETLQTSTVEEIIERVDATDIVIHPDATDEVTDRDDLEVAEQ